ncbi:MAG: sigma-70 family RNA polymerase sigma factor [Dolichospermum sp.]
MDASYLDNQQLLINFHRTKNIRLRNKIVEMNMGLVGHVAGRMTACCTVPREDLIQIGAEGLIKAVERFDPTKKIKLSSYAVPFIYGAMAQFVRDKARMVKVPRPLQEIHQKLKRHAQKHGVTYEQAAVQLNISLQLAKEAALACNQSNPELPDSLTVEEQEELETILPLIDKLPELHAAIIKSLYIDQIPVKTLCQLHDLKLKELHRIESESLQKLKLIIAGRVQCPNCKSYQTIKNGKRDGKQSYLCKSCQTQFRENPLPNGRRGYSNNVKLKVLEAIANGKSSYWCETYLGIDHSTASLWSKNYVIDNSINLSKKQMSTSQSQWQITSKFTSLADYLIKNCGESPELDEALKLLNQSMQKSQKAVEVAKK